MGAMCVFGCFILAGLLLPPAKTPRRHLTHYRAENSPPRVVVSFTGVTNGPANR